MEEDEDLNILMAGLRGQNLDTSDFAAADTRMDFLDFSETNRSDHPRGDLITGEGDALPLTYQPAQIAAYWGRRPVSVVRRVLQLINIGGSFLSGLVWDAINGTMTENEVKRAIEIRDILTRLGPAYIKLGQALSIRPDLLSPAAMRELQKLCDKVPSFDNKQAMDTIERELGRPHTEVFAELSRDPIAAASLGQVYKGKLFSGEDVAVKVQVSCLHPE